MQRGNSNVCPRVGRRGDVGTIYVNGTFEMIITAIHHYRRALEAEANSELRDTFNRVFRTYGLIRVEGMES
jgi:hypothetical protein